MCFQPYACFLGRSRQGHVRRRSEVDVSPCRLACGTVAVSLGGRLVSRSAFCFLVPSRHWHAQEMLVGSFGGALLGFLTSALPEWTDTRRISGRPLFLFAGLWAGARVLGLLAVENGWLIGLMFDQAWILFLLAYALRLSWTKKSTDLLGFILFVTAFAAAAAMLRIAMAFELYDLSESAIRILGFALLGLLGLALARITVPVTNLILDPTEKTSPYRPHPGRIHLSAGLTMLVILAEAATLSDAVRGYLMVAAGAAFLDRVAEGFVGREGFSFELGGLWLSSALAGTGLLICGLSLIGLPLPWLGGLHLALMGGWVSASCRFLDCRPAPYRSTAALFEDNPDGDPASGPVGASPDPPGIRAVPLPALRRLRSDLCAVFALISPLGQGLYSSALVTGNGRSGKVLT